MSKATQNTTKSRRSAPPVCKVEQLGHEWKRHFLRWQNAGADNEVRDPHTGARIRLFEIASRQENEANEAMRACRLVASHLTPTTEAGWAFLTLCAQDFMAEGDHDSAERVIATLRRRYDALLEAA
jgi:hypothetical protein